MRDNQGREADAMQFRAVNMPALVAQLLNARSVSLVAWDFDNTVLCVHATHRNVTPDEVPARWRDDVADLDFFRAAVMSAIACGIQVAIVSFGRLPVVLAYLDQIFEDSPGLFGRHNVLTPALLGKRCQDGRSYHSGKSRLLALLKVPADRILYFDDDAGNIAECKKAGFEHSYHTPESFQRVGLAAIVQEWSETEAKAATLLPQATAAEGDARVGRVSVGRLSSSGDADDPCSSQRPKRAALGQISSAVKAAILTASQKRASAPRDSGRDLEAPSLMHRIRPSTRRRASAARGCEREQMQSFGSFQSHQRPAGSSKEQVEPSRSFLRRRRRPSAVGYIRRSRFSRESSSRVPDEVSNTLLPAAAPPKSAGKESKSASLSVRTESDSVRRISEEFRIRRFRLKGSRFARPQPPAQQPDDSTQGAKYESERMSGWRQRRSSWILRSAAAPPGPSLRATQHRGPALRPLLDEPSSELPLLFDEPSGLGPAPMIGAADKDWDQVTPHREASDSCGLLHEDCSAEGVPSSAYELRIHARDPKIALSVPNSQKLTHCSSDIDELSIEERSRARKSELRAADHFDDLDKRRSAPPRKISSLAGGKGQSSKWLGSKGPGCNLAAFSERDSSAPLQGPFAQYDDV